MSGARGFGVLWLALLWAGCTGDLEGARGDDADMAGAPDAERAELGAPLDLGALDEGGAGEDLLEEADAPEMDAPEMSAPPDMPVEPPPAPCMTRVSYGAAWIRGDRQTLHDDVRGVVGWDGVCHADAAGNSYAELSNGWRPYFEGRGSCVIGLDQRGDCPAAPTACATRITYGPRWLKAPNHPAQHDDVAGVVTWEGTCRASGSSSYARLSNGWEPHFQGAGACDLSLRHTQCGGLFVNPVIASDCPDPGVTRDGARYVLTCTNTSGGGIFPIYTSPDLVSWTFRGKILADRPAWANDRFWAPEIHEVSPGRYVAYYSASARDNNRLSIGAATATAATGPFTDLGRPLIRDNNPGVIDAHYFAAADGRRFLTWKRDGNAVGQRTPIFIQELEADGVTLRGAPSTILTNDQGWEGALVEGQWIVERGGYFYMFYSGNGYASTSYGVGVARASSPTGPYTKASGPILTTNGAWDGPGHGAVLKGPSGDWVHVYHAWVKGKAGQAPGRFVLVDRVTWDNGWPKMLGAPSKRSQPMP